MKINEKTLFAFANAKPVDKEGYLSKRGEGKLKKSEKSFTQQKVFLQSKTFTKCTPNTLSVTE